MYAQNSILCQFGPRNLSSVQQLISPSILVHFWWELYHPPMRKQHPSHGSHHTIHNECHNHKNHQCLQTLPTNQSPKQHYQMTRQVNLRHTAPWNPINDFHPTSMYPYQSNPNMKAWRIWQAFLFTTVCNSHLSLKTNLGQWLHTGTNLHRQWKP